jgi:tryptophan synthase alpha subunit
MTISRGHRCPIQPVRSIDDQVCLCREIAERRGADAMAVFADAAISGSHILSEIENGKRTGPVQTLQAIARALDVGLDEIAPR